RNAFVSKSPGDTTAHHSRAKHGCALYFASFYFRAHSIRFLHALGELEELNQALGNGSNGEHRKSFCLALQSFFDFKAVNLGKEIEDFERSWVFALGGFHHLLARLRENQSTER